VNTVTASFNSIMGQVTEISQRKKTVKQFFWPGLVSADAWGRWYQFNKQNQTDRC